MQLEKKKLKNTKRKSKIPTKIIQQTLIARRYELNKLETKWVSMYLVADEKSTHTIEFSQFCLRQIEKFQIFPNRDEKSSEIHKKFNSLYKKKSKSPSTWEFKNKNLKNTTKFVKFSSHHKANLGMTFSQKLKGHQANRINFGKSFSRPNFLNDIEISISSS